MDFKTVKNARQKVSHQNIQEIDDCTTTTTKCKPGWSQFTHGRILRKERLLMIYTDDSDKTRIKMENK